MNRVPDRARMRREYLRQMLFANLMVGVAAIFAVSSGLMTIYYIVSYWLDWIPAAYMNECACGLIFFAGLAVLGAIGWKHSDRQARSVLYIPPFPPTVDDLPAEEVLLRGSQSLPAAPEELLRASVGE